MPRPHFSVVESGHETLAFIGGLFFHSFGIPIKVHSFCHRFSSCSDDELYGHKEQGGSVSTVAAVALHC